MLTNGVSPHRVVGCTIGTKKKGVKFFFKFFFRWVWVIGCGCSGVGARVWVLGCGCSGVGRRDGDGRARDVAGWIGIVAVGWLRIELPGRPHPGFGLPARV